MLIYIYISEKRGYVKSLSSNLYKIFTVSFRIINREGTAMASADFQVKRINLEVK